MWCAAPPRPRGRTRAPGSGAELWEHSDRQEHFENVLETSNPPVATEGVCLAPPLAAVDELRPLRCAPVRGADLAPFEEFTANYGQEGA